MSNPGESEAAHVRRRRKWIRPDVQVRIILLTLSVAIIVLAINFQLDLLALASLERSPATTVDGLAGVARSAILRQLLLSVLLAVPLAIWVGAIHAFRFCGPIFRFRRYFQELIEGRWDRPCTLRIEDDLQDVKDSINASLDEIRLRLRSHHDFLRRVRPLVQAAVEATHGSEAEDILREIEREEAELSRRFPGGEVLPAVPVPESVCLEV
jgi:hypothetical protein